MLSNSKAEEYPESMLRRWTCDTIKLKIQKAKIFPNNYSLKEIWIYAKSINCQNQFWKIQSPISETLDNTEQMMQEGKPPNIMLPAAVLRNTSTGQRRVRGALVLWDLTSESCSQKTIHSLACACFLLLVSPLSLEKRSWYDYLHCC